ncbi:MAG: Crp/Fnr family transcriptional regulator [Saprospiraceae bacterium]
MDTQNIWFLENIDVTGIFCPTKMESRDSSSTHVDKQYKKGDYIYLPNEHSNKIYLINKGRVKIGKVSESNKEITKVILSKGELFGELSLIGQGKRTDYAQAMEETTVCILSREEMTSLLKEHNSFYLYIMNIMGNRTLAIEKRLESLVFKDSRSRIIEFLLDLNTKKGERVGYEWVVRKFLTHQEIANFTATSRQTVTTVLNELKGKNLLTFNRKRLLLRDIDKIKNEIA